MSALWKKYFFKLSFEKKRLKIVLQMLQETSVKIVKLLSDASKVKLKFKCLSGKAKRLVRATAQSAAEKLNLNFKVFKL